MQSSPSFPSLLPAGLALVLLALGGCASVTGTGNRQQMYVQTQASPGVPLEAADCTLSNDKGSWTVRSPGDTNIARSNRAMLVQCRAAGLPAGSVSVESATRAAMFGNILIGGIIGVAIDHSSGAAYEYPGIVTVVLGQAGSVKMEYAQGGGQPGSPPGAGPVAVPRNLPPPSTYAALDDVSRLPSANPRTQNLYRTFLTRRSPRAFVVAADGRGFFANGLAGKDPTKPGDPALRALEYCKDSGRAGCQLYAVDSTVVYVPPPAAAAAVAGAPPLPLPVVAPMEPKQHAFQIPPVSNYAALTDASSVPVSATGQGRYLHFLTLQKPRAFVVYADGGWYMSWNSATAMSSALGTCERAGRQCWLYAVDDDVVWQSDVSRRIGHASQLVPAR